MADYIMRYADRKKEDALKPGSDLVISESELINVQAEFRRFGQPVRVRVPWGKKEFWNFIAVVESVGTDEAQQWQDNIFIHQEIAIGDDAQEPTKYWVVSARCFYSYWNPPQPDKEPGVSVRVRTLAVLK